MTKKKDGKLFEEDISNAATKERIFNMKIKDTFIPAQYRMEIRVSKNNYDFLLFDQQHLFTIELKSTKQKSISFDEKIIKQHQIDELEKASKYKNVISGFLLNFREPESKVYFIEINDFLKYKHTAQSEFTVHSYKSKINKSSIPIAICEEIGIEIEGKMKIKRYGYDIGKFISDAIEKYSENGQAETNKNNT